MAIPTRYSGVQFRSRLEARWAAMFDLLDWRWEYEPVDLEGYIPDFVVLFPAGGVLVEVKPEYTVDALVRSTAAKIDRSGWESTNSNDALIVGATWNASGTSAMEGYPILGAIRQTSAKDHCWCAAEWIRCRDCGAVSTYHFIWKWACTACGTYGKVYGEPPDDLRDRWNDAGNAVQWRAPRR